MKNKKKKRVKKLKEKKQEVPIILVNDTKGKIGTIVAGNIIIRAPRFI